MQITRTADIGVRVMTHLAMQPSGTRMTVTELAEQSDAAVPFTSRILQRLVAARLLVSHRGYVGGFELALPARSISLLDIVAALDGPLCVNACLPGGSGCGRKAWCGAHGVWANAQQALASVLASESLERLAAAATSNRARLGISAASDTIARNIHNPRRG
jgi:Rrf2 family protein